VAAAMQGTMTERRRLPPPWTTEDNGACFIIRDANGQALAYVYYEQEPGRRTAANLLPSQYPRRAGCPVMAIRRRRPITEFA